MLWCDSRRLYVLCAVIFLINVDITEGSHFRGAAITWRPLSQPTDGSLPMIEVSWRVAWRRSSTAGACNEIGSFNSGEGTLGCANCDLSLPLNYNCTEFSVAEDWTIGVGRGFYQPTTRVLNLTWSGCCWVSGASWSFLTTVDLSIREDTGLINFSPTTSAPPIVPFKLGCDNSFVIPTQDEDPDDIRCFWATTCGGICGPIPGFTLDELSCTLTLPASAGISEGLYEMALEVKDFNSQESSTPLSEIPSQFFILVFSSPIPCDAIPALVPSTRECGSCIKIPEGTIYTDRLVARAADGLSIASFDTLSPPGLTISAVMPLSGESNDYYIDVSWDPGSSTSEDFCVRPVDNGGNIGQYCCFVLSIVAVDMQWEFQCIVTPPVLDLRSLKPINLLALAGGGPDQFSMTFRGRDNPEYYSDGRSVEYSETKGTVTGDESKLRRHEAVLRQPLENYHQADRFGVHYCNYFSTEMRFEAQVLIHSQKTLIPKNSIRTIILSVGETLTLCVEPNLPRTWKGPLVWRFEGLEEASWLHRWTGSTCIHVKHIQTCQAGVYEAYRRICGRHVKQHAFFDVRVRACPSGFHTPPACTGTCNAACILGYCGDDGSCVCKNGMTGENCDTATAGYLGLISGDVACSTVGLDPDCQSSLVCTQHAGCSCLPGWKGINCDEECGPLQWGPDCAFACEGGVPCDRFTGKT